MVDAKGLSTYSYVEARFRVGDYSWIVWWYVAYTTSTVKKIQRGPIHSHVPNVDGIT